MIRLIWVAASILLCVRASGVFAQGNAPGVLAEGNSTFRAYQAQMAAAEKSLRLNEAREFRRWLDACEPALRGWEWRFLESAADTSVRKVATKETPIRITASAKGDRLAVVEGSRVRLLSWPALQNISVIEGHTDAVYRAEFSPDGTRLITVSRDVTSRTWDLESGRQVASIELANPAFAATTLSPDGAAAATCAWERDEAGDVHGVVWVWDPSSGAVRHRTRVGVKPLSAIRYTPDGALIVVGSWDGLVHVLGTDADEIRRLALPKEGVYNAVNDIAVSPDGRLIAAASKDRTIRVFSVEGGDLVASLRGHAGYVEGVAFSPDGASLVTTSVDATAAVWSTADWSRQSVLRGASGTVRGAVWATGSTTVVGCSLGGELLAWDASAGDPGTTTIRTERNGIYSAALSPDGSEVAVACYDGWVRLYDSRSGHRLREWEAHPGSTCHAAAFSADGKRLVTCSWDKTARVWNPSDGQAIATLDAKSGVYAVAISPDGSRIATSGRVVEVWRSTGGEPIHNIAVEGAQPRRLEFSSDGALLASAWDDGRARVHRVSDGALAAMLVGGTSGLETVAFLPGDAKVATGDGEGVVRLFPVRGGDSEFAIDTGGRGVYHLVCSGHRIAAATDQLWIIDAQNKGIVAGFRPHEDSIWHLCWSRDGARLATCDSSGIIKILGAASGKSP